MTNDILIHFAMLSVLAVPFLLPHMHERYFYVADVFAVIYAVLYRKRWPVPVIVVASSFLVYGMYLFGFSWMNAVYAAIPMFLTLCVVAYDTVKLISESKCSNIAAKKQVTLA